ncbi:hypothetical protein HHI36_002057 [Cryptolaemus montrouzieri]|uniref:Uncharacterized protein n=1 Tax=Cryptolaemus montrouzieri TaxID=559131 RepID=A0ABD2PA37_9CUCU
MLKILTVTEEEFEELKNEQPEQKMDGTHEKNHISTDAGGNNEQERKEDNPKSNNRRHKKKKSAKVRNSVNRKASGYSDVSKSSNERKNTYSNNISNVKKIQIVGWWINVAWIFQKRI